MCSPPPADRRGQCFWHPTTHTRAFGMGCARCTTQTSASLLPSRPRPSCTGRRGRRRCTPSSPPCLVSARADASRTLHSSQRAREIQWSLSCLRLSALALKTLRRHQALLRVDHFDHVDAVLDLECRSRADRSGCCCCPAGSGSFLTSWLLSAVRSTKLPFVDALIVDENTNLLDLGASCARPSCPSSPSSRSL